MTVHVVLWKWQGKPNVQRSYTAQHVDVLSQAVKKNAGSVDVRVVCVTDDPTGITQTETYPLWPDCGELENATKENLPSCYRRLKIYDIKTQREMGIPRGQRIVSLDLDTVVTGDLSGIFRWEGTFVGWALAGHPPHDTVYNGSFQMFTAGTLRHVWEEFDPETSPRAAKLAGFLGSDQSWLSWKLVGKPGHTDIPYPVLASYPLHCRRLGSFSAKTRLVFFHGRRKPWDHQAQEESGWIRRYWRP